ncbi:pilus assembly protein TadG-related protein [Streptomyces sp. NBC_00726]|uniref:TadE/TadG family type IV pilus assembly protein n=1 Tax=Streptomyces sp. NBC_00726 TaxID=2903674 RepID=UPI00386A475C
MKARRETPLAWRAAWRGRLDDRGSGAGAVIIFALVFMVLAAFVIDGGLAISQRERAADIAEQAARYAAQDIDRAALYDESGGAAPINFGNCDARVRAFAREQGMSEPDVAASGCVTADAQRVEAEIRLTYQPVLSGMLFGGQLTVHGRSVAESVAG